MKCKGISVKGYIVKNVSLLPMLLRYQFSGISVTNFLCISYVYMCIVHIYTQVSINILKTQKDSVIT